MLLILLDMGMISKEVIFQLKINLVCKSLPSYKDVSNFVYLFFLEIRAHSKCMLTENFIILFF